MHHDGGRRQQAAVEPAAEKVMEIAAEMLVSNVW